MTREGPKLYIYNRININRKTGCWLWAKSIRPDGYAYGWDGNQKCLAHRLAYEAFKGPIPKGLTIDHLCVVRHCVNPNHLEAVTGEENTLRRRCKFCKARLEAQQKGLS